MELLPAEAAPPASAPVPVLRRPIDSACTNRILVAEDAGRGRPSDAEELAPLDRSGLNPTRLQQLDGQRIRLRVITDSGVWRVGHCGVFEAVMKDAGDDLATVWMYANPDVEDGMTVEGRLRVVRHPTIGVGGDARVVQPRFGTRIAIQ